MLERRCARKRRSNQILWREVLSDLFPEFGRELKIGRLRSRPLAPGMLFTDASEGIAVSVRNKGERDLEEHGEVHRSDWDCGIDECGRCKCICCGAARSRFRA